MDQDNVVNLLMDIDIKIMESKQRLEKISDISDKLKDRHNKLEERLYDQIFKYDVTDILDLLNISETIKILISLNVNNIVIYRLPDLYDEQLIIKYDYNNRTIEFMIYSNHGQYGNIVYVYDDGVKSEVFDIKREFIAFDFKKFKINRFLENYVDLIIKNKKSLRLGMILMAYYYLIYYLQYQNSDIDTLIVIYKDSTKKIEKLFKNDLSSYTLDKCYNQYIHKPIKNDITEEKIDVKLIVDKLIIELNNKNHINPK